MVVKTLLVVIEHELWRRHVANGLPDMIVVFDVLGKKCVMSVVFFLLKTCKMCKKCDVLCSMYNV